MVKTTNIKSIETVKFNIALVEDDLIRIDVKANTVVKKADIEENYKIYSKFLDHKPALFLVIFGENVTASEDARAELANFDRDQIKIAEAAVIPSMVTRIMAQLFMTFHKPQHPAEMFSSEDEAMTWLLNHRKSA
ncbi:MAG: hypothetical protein HRT71_11575 [Flavobacteriales bacterium]|nr:hypothetical protein [Flavobacteriales bacterium]